MPLGKLDKFSAVAGCQKDLEDPLPLSMAKKIAASNISFLKQVSHPCISTKVIYPLLISVNLDVFLEAYILSFLYLFSKHVRFISKAHLGSQGLNLCGTPGGDFPPSAAGGNNHYFNPWLTGGW